MTVADESLLTAERVADPYPYFHALRSQDPVHWSNSHRAWLLTRYDDVATAFHDSRLSADRISPLLDRITHARNGELPAVFALLRHWLVFKDAPDHTRLRRLAGKAFTRRAVERMRTVLECAVAALTADLEDRLDFDLIEDFAFPLPAIGIAGILGVPAEDRHLFKKWSDAMTGLIFGAADAADNAERGEPALGDLADYLRDRAERCRAKPDESVISALVKAEADDDRLSMDEVIATSMLLLFAGHESTTSLIASACLALLRHPDQLELLIRDPALVPAAVEETLRFDGSTKVALRVVADDHERRGKHLQRGDRVFLVAGAAGRDPARFPDPDRFDILRGDKVHLNFGGGIHFCLGAPLARLEMEVALLGLRSVLPRLMLATPTPAWHPTVISRGLISLPVRKVPTRMP